MLVVQEVQLILEELLVLLVLVVQEQQEELLLVLLQMALQIEVAVEEDMVLFQGFLQD